MNKDALDFQEKDASDTISVVFNTSFFIQLTGLNSTSAQSRRVDVPVSMIAVAINNLNKVVNLHQMIGWFLLFSPHFLCLMFHFTLESPGPRSPPSQTSIEAEASSKFVYLVIQSPDHSYAM